MLLIELNAWEDEWFVPVVPLQEKKNERKKRPKKRKEILKSDLVCGQFINICKFGAN